MDYVSGWYIKSALYMKNTTIDAAFVSTNSISQGVEVAIIWKPIFDLGININFAYRSFVWDNEATNKAKVHCVIIGFSYKNYSNKRIFDSDNKEQEVNYINPYLLNAPTVFIKRRVKPLSSNVKKIFLGSQPLDDGQLVLSKDEKDNLVKKYPNLKK